MAGPEKGPNEQDRKLPQFGGRIAIDVPRTAVGIWQIVLPWGSVLRGADPVELVHDMPSARDDVLLWSVLGGREQADDPTERERPAPWCLSVDDSPLHMSVFETEQ